MAQHFDVTNQVPAEVKRSLQRLVEYANKPWHRKLLPWHQDTWYTKRVTLLPKEYADYSGSQKAMSVGPYHCSFPDLFKGNQECKFEVHYNENVITKIFLPL